MGCWNGTCGLTRLPIKAGEPVYGMIITRSQYAMDASDLRGHHTSGLCYITDNYYPIAPLFSGRYNDYGCIDDFPKAEQHLRDLIHANLAPKVISSAEILEHGGNTDTMAEYDGDAKERESCRGVRRVHHPG